MSRQQRGSIYYIITSMTLSDNKVPVPYISIDEIIEEYLMLLSTTVGNFTHHGSSDEICLKLKNPQKEQWTFQKVADEDLHRF